MMLGKRGRPVQKDQSKGHLMSDSSSDSFFSPRVLVQKARNTSFFTIPGQLVGFGSKSAAPDAADAVRSPTSPLDYKVFSCLGSSFLGSPRSSGHDGKPRSWDSSRVGLGLLDALAPETNPCGKVSSVFSDSSNILFGSQLRINITSPKSQLGALRNDALGAAPKSLPKDYGISSRPQTRSPAAHLGCSKMALGLKGAEFGILRSCSADVSGSSLPPLTRFMYHDPKPSSEVFSSDLNSTFDSPLSVQGDANFENFARSLHASDSSAHALISSLSPSEIEQSEDYTCIISHGPNPKTTHIFGDCILESSSIQTQEFRNEHKKEISPIWMLKPSEVSPSCAFDNFLSFCCSCKRKLEEGRDIYMYRGEKAFCSSECRDQEILIEEEMEKPKVVSSGLPGCSSEDDIFPGGMAMQL